jgi:GNAT superfamily N-acetyltransferase
MISSPAAERGRHVEARVATAGDAAGVVDTLARAFFADPVWGWAFADAKRRIAQQSAWFELLVHSGLGNGSVWTTPGHEAVAVWVPPGREELCEADEARLWPMLEETVGSRAALIMEVFERFEAAHPHDQRHYYLSLLATHPGHRGRGHGMALLADGLARVDAEGAPAYLESTNPVNDKRYESVGFEVCGSFGLPEGGPRVTTMWREPRARGPAGSLGQGA